MLTHPISNKGVQGNYNPSYSAVKGVLYHFPGNLRMSTRMTSATSLTTGEIDQVASWELVAREVGDHRKLAI